MKAETLFTLPLYQQCLQHTQHVVSTQKHLQNEEMKYSEWFILDYYVRGKFGQMNEVKAIKRFKT